MVERREVAKPFRQIGGLNDMFHEGNLIRRDERMFRDAGLPRNFLNA